METIMRGTSAEKPKIKRKSWSKEETVLFLSCYNHRKHEFTARKHRLAYANVLQDMFDVGFEDRSIEIKHLEGRMKTLLDVYRHAKNNARKTGGSYKAPFMDELDKIFGKEINKRQKPGVKCKETACPSNVNVVCTGNSKCGLCLRNCTEFKNLFDGNGRATATYSTTIKYFDPMHLNLSQEYPNAQTVICLLCWSHIYEFDSFKNSILLAQTTLNQTKRKKEEEKTLERIFGKQQGYDPLAVSSIANKNSVDNEEEKEGTANDDYDHDMSDGEDQKEKARSSSHENSDTHEEEESEEEGDAAGDLKSNFIHFQKVVTTKPETFNKLKDTRSESISVQCESSKTKEDGQFLKFITKYREPDENELCSNQLFCDDDSMMILNEFDESSDMLDELMSINNNSHKPEIVCDACGKCDLSQNALRDHACDLDCK